MGHDPAGRVSYFKELLQSCQLNMVPLTTVENMLDCSPFLANYLRARFILLNAMFVIITVIIIIDIIIFFVFKGANFFSEVELFLHQCYKSKLRSCPPIDFFKI